MAVAHRSLRVDLSGPTLLLGDHRPAARTHDGVDVVLVDLAGVGPHDAGALVAAVQAEHPGRPVGVRGGEPPAVGASLDAGVGLVVLDVASPAVETRAVAEAGVVLVLSGGEPADGASVVDDLVAHGIDPGRVVVELGPVHSLADRFAALEHLAYGFHVGAAMRPTPGDADAATVGAEIGMLTGLLTGGAVTVRGADPRRFRRVQAVVAALDSAAVDPMNGPRSAISDRPEVQPEADADDDHHTGEGRERLT